MFMKKLAYVIALTTATALGAGTARADIHCTPDISVHYKKGAGSSIKVVSLAYRLTGTNVWHVQDVTDQVIDKGKAFTFPTQRLGAVAKGQTIDLRAVFKADAGKGYGAEERSPIRVSTKACENNVKYNIDVE